MSTTENIEDVYKQISRNSALSRDQVIQYVENLKNLRSDMEDEEFKKEVKKLEFIKFETMKRNAFREEERRRIRLQTGQKKWRKEIPKKKKKRK